MRARSRIPGATRSCQTRVVHTAPSSFAFLAVVVSLCGCAAMSVNAEYSSAKAATVTTTLPKGGRKMWRIRQHPTDSGRALVEEDLATGLGKAFVEGLSLTLVDMDAATARFDEALLQWLRSTRGDCRIDRSSMVPDLGVDYRFSCDAASAAQ
jgi:ABC-type uncharacterized transport system auxiliary subunit